MSDDTTTTAILNNWSVREIVQEQDTLARGSEFMYEGARFVCHVRTELVPTVYTILGNFYAGLWAMKDATEYMATDLDNAIKRGDAYHSNGGDPKASVEEAKAYLREAAYHANEMAAKLQAAQQAIAYVGHNDDGRTA